MLELIIFGSEPFVGINRERILLFSLKILQIYGKSFLKKGSPPEINKRSILPKDEEILLNSFLVSSLIFRFIEL